MLVPHPQRLIGMGLGDQIYFFKLPGKVNAENHCSGKTDIMHPAMGDKRGKDDRRRWNKLIFVSKMT